MSTTKRRRRAGTAANKATGRARPRLRDTARAEMRDVYRKNILEAAERVFARRGFFECKVVDIAREAGLAAGTLYNYFDGKEEIFQTMCTEHGREALARAREIAASVRDPMDRLAQHLRWVFEHMESKSRTIHIFAQMGVNTEWQWRAVGGAGVQENYRQHLELIQAAVTEAQKAGRVRRDVSAADLTALLAGITNAFVALWMHAPEPRPSLAGRTGLVLELFMQGASPR